MMRYVYQFFHFHDYQVRLLYADYQVRLVYFLMTVSKVQDLKALIVLDSLLRYYCGCLCYLSKKFPSLFFSFFQTLMQFLFV